MKVRYAPRAVRDLSAIRDRVLADSQSEAVANRLVADLLDAGDSLATLPWRFARYRYASEWR